MCFQSFHIKSQIMGENAIYRKYRAQDNKEYYLISNHEYDIIYMGLKELRMTSSRFLRYKNKLQLEPTSDEKASDEKACSVGSCGYGSSSKGNCRQQFSRMMQSQQGWMRALLHPSHPSPKSNLSHEAYNNRFE